MGVNKCILSLSLFTDKPDLHSHHSWWVTGDRRCHYTSYKEKEDQVRVEDITPMCSHFKGNTQQFLLVKRIVFYRTLQH